MNSIIASNINGETTISQQVAIGSRASLLLSKIEFAVTENKANSSFPCNQGKYLCQLNNKEDLFNGQKKKTSVDQNRNTLSNSFLNLNGNKEKAEEKDGMPTPKVQLYTGKVNVEWKQVYKIGAGLNNLGNTCFMNTVIQCLTYCPPLANYLLHDNDHTAKCTISGFCMMCLLQKHIRRTIGKSGDVIKPVDVYQRLKLIAKHFQFGRQEDAHEFLRYVIDNLWKSCLSQNDSSSKLDPASKETTVINQIFGGYHRSQVTCLRCKEKSNTFDHFMDFILDIKQNVLTLEKALDKFTQPELLQQENSYKCPKCKMKVAAQKKFSVYRAPNVATFQLKRFDYHRSFGGKITKQITYPEKLNLRPYMSETKGEPVLYHLNAVLVHSGPSCNSGHYYCYVKNSNGFWYIMDDQRVHQVSLNQVLNQSAYVLFYIKAGTSEGTSIKKCFENRNSFLKGNISTSDHRKITEISTLKSSPLTEVNQAALSSPPAKHPIFQPNNINKKANFSPNQSKERISVGVHSSVQNVSEVKKPSGMLHATIKNVKQPVTASKANNHCGLVPYIEGSSESSDENDNDRPVSSKVESVHKTPTFCKNINDHGAKHNMKTVVNDDSSQIEVNRKSISVNINKNLPSSPIPSSTPSKVIATGSWTVTDAKIASPSLGSGSSYNSVNSTTDWHVTSTDSDSSVKKTVNKTFSHDESETVREKELVVIPLKSPQSTIPFSNSDVHATPKQESKKMSYSNSQEKTVEYAAVHDGVNSSSNSKFQAPKCDFRKQHTQSKNSFHEDTKIFDRPQHSPSFLKRKCSEPNSKVSKEATEFPGSENRYSSVSKKIKCSEELTKLHSKTNKSCSETPNKLLVNVSEKYSNSKNVPPKSNTVHYKFISNFRPNALRQNGTLKIHGDKLLRTPEKNKLLKKLESDHEKISSSDSSSSNSSLEYVWVEKTKDSIEKGHRFTTKGKLEKRNDYNSESTGSRVAVDQNHNVVSELTKNSNYFYGASVPTWNGETHYKDSFTSVNEKRKTFDDYDDELDRGKVRRSKPKDRYQHFQKFNPFQKYVDRSYGYGNPRFNGKFQYNNYHHRKPYDSHYKWKQNQDHDFRRNKKYYRPPFHR